MINHYWIARAPGKLALVESEIPPPKKGELLIQIRAALTCGTDLKLLDRGHPKIPFPTPMGHEASGRIVACGPEVEGFEEGDAVMFALSSPCGQCASCQRGYENLCPQGMEEKVWGAFGEWMVLPEPLVALQVYHKPPQLSFAEAALLDPLASVIHAWNILPSQRYPRKVLILGSGAIAWLHGWMARWRGIEEVAFLARPSRRAQLLKEEGFEVRTWGSQEEGRKNLQGDLVIETTGHPQVASQGLSMVAPGGCLLLFAGMPSPSPVRLDLAFIHYNDIFLLGSFHYTRDDVSQAFMLLKEKALPFQNLFSQTFSLEKLPQALQAHRQGEGFKFIIQPHEGR